MVTNFHTPLSKFRTPPQSIHFPPQKMLDHLLSQNLKLFSRSWRIFTSSFCLSMYGGKYRSISFNWVFLLFWEFDAECGFICLSCNKYLIIQFDYFCCFDNLTRVWFQSKTGGAFSLKNSYVSKMWHSSQKEFCLNGKFSRCRKNLGPEESIWLPIKKIEDFQNLNINWKHRSESD